MCSWVCVPQVYMSNMHAQLCVHTQLYPILSVAVGCNPLGKNTGVDCHALLQGIVPTQGSTKFEPGLLCLLGVGRQVLYH